MARGRWQWRAWRRPRADRRISRGALTMGRGSMMDGTRGCRGWTAAWVSGACSAARAEQYGILEHDYTRVAADVRRSPPMTLSPLTVCWRLASWRRGSGDDEADALLGMLADLGVTVEDNAHVAGGRSSLRPKGVDPHHRRRRCQVRRCQPAATVCGQPMAMMELGDSSGTSAGIPTSPRPTKPLIYTAPGGTPSADELRALTVPQLKDLLREGGLKVGGKKDELVERLLEAQAAPTTSPAQAEAPATAGGAIPAVEAKEEDDNSGDGASSGASVDVAAVEALLEARGEDKQAKDYETADEITARLRAEYCVILDDKRRTWRVVVEYGGYYRVGPPVDPFTTKQVGDMLAKRTSHQELKEYEEADALHAELTEMGIVLDTRIRTWKKPRARERENRASSRPERPDRGQRY